MVEEVNNLGIAKEDIVSLMHTEESFFLAYYK
jgi:hypothetical protein